MNDVEKPVCGTLTVLMMASSPTHQGLLNAIQSLELNGYKDSKSCNPSSLLRYHVMGIGETWGGWPHRMKSYRLAAAKIAQKDPAGVVVCMDAYDALSVRSGEGLMSTFKSFGKQLVLSLESECMGNCVPIREWWNTHGSPHLVLAGITDGIPPADRYVNGGLLMGYANAVKELYDWMLLTGQNDDQRGLARYALLNPQLWAPDVAKKIFKNKVYGAQLTDQDLNSKGVYFAHFPGMRDWSGAGYDRTALAVLKRPSGLQSKNLGTPAKLASYIVALVVVCLALIFMIWILIPKQYKPQIHLPTITTILGPLGL